MIMIKSYFYISEHNQNGQKTNKVEKLFAANMLNQQLIFYVNKKSSCKLIRKQILK